MVREMHLRFCSFTVGPTTPPLGTSSSRSLRFGLAHDRAHDARLRRNAIPLTLDTTHGKHRHAGPRRSRDDGCPRR